jgi:hypothetical protein
MTDRIDHAAEARSLIGAHMSDWRNGEVAVAQGTEALVYATLALVEQQRIQNLIALAGLVFPDGRTHLPMLVTDPIGEYGVRVKPEIAAALGVEGDPS